MSTKLTYTGAEVQELLDKIEKGDFDNAKTLEGHPASYFAIASELTSLAESFATEQGRINTLYSYFNNGSANDALRLGGQLPSYYATTTQFEILQQTLSDFKSLFDSMFEKDSDENIHAKLSLWSSGGITAGRVGSGGSGGGGISYNRLDSWSDYSADKAGYVLSALLGKDLDNRVSALANAGYITASALAPYALRSEIPSLDGYFLASNFNQANIKSTLGISDWALASVKPTYTASEVGALSVNGGHIYGSLYITKSSKQVYIAYEGTSESLGYIGFNGKNSPIYIPSEANVIYSLIHSGNYSDYALPITGGTVNGSITATSFIGNLTGTADRAFTQVILYGNRDVNLWDTNTSTARYFALGDTAQNTPSGVYALGSILMEYSWDVNAGAQLLSHHSKNNIFYRSRWNGAFKDWREIAFTDSNVASATKLATPRTIWGQSFDGTQDVTGALTAPSITTNSLTIGGVTLTYDSGNEALCINGNMHALGGVTAGGAGISAYSSLETRVARLEQKLNIS